MSDVSLGRSDNIRSREPGQCISPTGSALESLCSRLVFCKPRATTGSNDQEITAVSRGHPMSWITIVWSMNAAACLTLAGIYLLVWCKQHKGWVLVFSCSAVAAAALTAFELVLLRVQTTEQYGAILRWVQLPVWVLVVSLVVSCSSISVPGHHGSHGVSAACGHWR